MINELDDIKSVFYKNKVKIITLNNGEKYALYTRKSNVLKTYNYLTSRGFNDFLHPIEFNNSYYEIYPYIEDNVSIEDKAKDLIYIMAMLHTKTTIYENLDKDRVKEIYEDISGKINYLDSYYHDLQDYIETKEFMSPAQYLLIRNISKIYASLYYCKDSLEEWYKLILTKQKQRKVFLHNNISLDHFLENKKAYLINWKRSKKDYVIYDFVSFYRNEYNNVEMIDLFDLYQSKYKYTKDEYILFSILIVLPYKIDFSNDVYLDTIKVRQLINFVLIGDKFLSEENKKYKTTHDNKF